MGTLDVLFHLTSFFAPAFFVAGVLALLGPVVVRKRPGAPVLMAQLALNFLAGGVALSLGLWIFGNDGKMASYGAMLLMCTAAQASSGRWGK